MADHVDTLVIGSGAIGVSTAYYLAKSGREVALIDKGEVCSGCSYGNAGLVVPSDIVPLAAPRMISKGIRWLLDPESPFYIKPRMDPDLAVWLWKFQAACREGPMRLAMPVLRDLHAASMELFKDLVETEGLEFGFERRGWLKLYKTQAGFEEAVEEACLVRECGVESRILEGADLWELVPEGFTDAVGAVYYPDDGHIDPAAFVCELARLVERSGGRLYTSTEVMGFEISGRRITTVQTTRGDFLPERVILATGAWSSSLARSLNVKLPIQPAKGYSITVERPADWPDIPLMLGEAKVAVTPMGEKLRFAGTLELSGLDLSLNQRRLTAIRRAVRNYLPGAEKFKPIEIWRGLRPCSPDGLPVIGRTARYENLIIATGHGMLGISLAPITGKIVSQLISKETPQVSSSPLSPARFG